MNFNCYYFNSNLKQRDFGKALEDFIFCILYFFGGRVGLLLMKITAVVTPAGYKVEQVLHHP